MLPSTLFQFLFSMVFFLLLLVQIFSSVLLVASVRAQTLNVSQSNGYGLVGVNAEISYLWQRGPCFLLRSSLITMRGHLLLFWVGWYTPYLCDLSEVAMGRI